MLLIIAAALFLGFAVILWIASLWLQTWLYEAPQGMIIPRALVSGAVLSLFLTAWAAIYRSDPGRIDTLVNYSREKLEGTYNEFQAIKKVGDKELAPMKFIRRASRDFSTNEYRSAEGNKAYNRSDGEGMFVAILINEKDKAEPTRFDANLTKDGKFPREYLLYIDKDGRYMDANTLGVIYRKRSGGMILSILANALHIAVWAVVLWFGMRFALNHAIGIGLIFWLIVMLGVQPTVFGLVTNASAPAAAPAKVANP